MALNTNKNLRNLNIYQVFLRQHLGGKFTDLISDLKRIKELNMDVIYLLPIHPIGELNKKGTVGSPYSIKDYLKIDESFGTVEEFKLLIEEAHKLKLKVMIDIVFHHTSFDSILLKEHPEWYFRRDGKLAGKIGDWSDITDLDFDNKELWDYLIDVLLYYQSLGVDGIRADVASLVPMKFWIKARKALRKRNSKFIMLAESVHLSFIKYIRDIGEYAASDSEAYEAFDILYDYDIDVEFMNYLEGKSTLNNWLMAIQRQEVTFPDNYVKLRNLENHDKNRIAHYIKDEKKLIQLTAFNFFLKGTSMIYAGQEYGIDKRPELFELDKVDFTKSNPELYQLVKDMAKLRKKKLFSHGNFNIHLNEKEVALITYENQKEKMIGIFNIGNEDGEIEVPFVDGTFKDYLYKKKIIIKDNKINLKDYPVIITIKK